jgi:phosphopantothenoylcysteine decarboxylase/phosphopantothenate--cysteine ligase
VRRRRPGQLIIGFAAETDNQLENGRAKLLRKGADAIVVNTVTGDGVGIEADSNAATFLTLTTSIELHEMPKRQLADRILDEVLMLRRPSSLVVEMDEHVEEKTRQDQVLEQAAAPAGTRRQLIVE